MPAPPFVDRTLRVPPGAARSLDCVLRELYPGASWNAVRRLVLTGKVAVDGARCTDARASIAAGSLVSVTMTAPRPRATGLSESAIVYVDPQVAVVDKPAGVSTVPYDQGERGTLDQLVRDALARREKRRRELGVVHRIDKETSGLVVFARTLSAKRHLEEQFRRHSVHRCYLAVVEGRLEAATLSSRLVRDRGDGLRGSTDNPRLGRPSTTHVRVVERFANATLVECRLETGRTHQIRIHVSEAGHPIVGDRVYSRGYAGARVDAPRLALHAAELGFEQPSTRRELRFRAPLPADFAALLARLRATLETEPRQSR